MRREQQVQERRKTLLTIGATVLISALIIGAVVWQLLRQDDASSSPLATIGVPVADAGCRPLRSEVPRGDELSGSAGSHVDEGTPITYRFSPPAFGPHWSQFLTPGQARTFWTADDRPPVERLVHSLEHGWTILWYDETIADDDTQVSRLRSIADNFLPVDAAAQKLMVAPWTSEDGTAFPVGTHLALTHWSVAGDSQAAVPGVAQGQQGVWEYCRSVSGDVVGSFMKTHPWDDAPEPGSP